MAEPLFDIVFRGDIVLGHAIADVKARLGQLFKVDAAKVDVLFAGGAVPLKRNVDQATAEKYKAVLTKAGAQVQIRPAGKDKAKVTPTPKPTPEPKSPAPIAKSESGRAQSPDPVFTLAPVGSLLLNPSDTRRRPVLDLDLSAISLKPMEGDLLEASEKIKAPIAEIQSGDYELAAPGVALLEGYERDDLPLMEIDPDFDLADVGSDLLDAAERPKQQSANDIDTAHLSVLPNDN